MQNVQSSARIAAREPGRDRLLADAEVRRPADEPLEEQLLGARLEAGGTRPSSGTAARRGLEVRGGGDGVGHVAVGDLSTALATNSSCDGNLVMTCGPSAVITTSSSIRAAE